MEKEKEASKIAEEVVNKATIIAEKVLEKANETAQKVLEKANDTAQRVLLITQTLEYIKKDIEEIKGKLERNYVSKEEFLPIKLIVYATVSAAGLAAIGAILNIILK